MIDNRHMTADRFAIFENKDVSMKLKANVSNGNQIQYCRNRQDIVGLAMTRISLTMHV